MSMSSTTTTTTTTITTTTTTITSSTTSRSSWYCPFKIPLELGGNLEPLVYLVGLNNESNQIHQCAWEMLNQKNHNKEFQPNYRSVSYEYQFPTKKPKMENIETYVPHGILNINWPSKHLSVIPSAVVLFFDMNWADPFWADKKTECAKLVKDLKSVLAPHGTHVLVMLIRDSECSGEDNFSTERASALCASAEIPPKCLFVLAHNHIERIQACVQRLEAGIYELSNAYYIARVRKVKNWKDRTTQLPLLVRYNIKIGFFHEIRKDVVNALSNYSTALSALLGIKCNDGIVQELKVIASIINYRIVRIHLTKMEFKEAKSQFDKHIQSFIKLEGSPKLVFEHLAWLEFQYFQFGELLKVHHRFGPSNLSNPVTYLTIASKYAEKRKYFLEKNILPKLNDLSSSINHTQVLNDLKYFGQRPWTTGPFSPDSQNYYEEPKSINLLKFHESQVKHSDLIVNHLGLASEFCLKISRMRSRCHLMSLMGQELYNAQEYGKCLTLLSLVLREFGKEKWSTIIYFVVDLGLRASLADGDLSKYLNFLIFSLKLDLHVFISKERRCILWSGYLAILNNQVPLAEPGSNFSVNRENWEKNLLEPCTTYVDIHTDCILECQVFFVEESVKIMNSATVRLLIRNRHDFPISIRKYGVRFNPPEYNAEFETKNYLQPDETCELELSIKPLPRDVSKIIKIQVAYIDIGNDEKSIFLHYSLIAPQNPYLWNSEWKKDQSKQCSLKIEPAKPLLKVDVLRKNPALVNEWHKIRIKWTNEDSDSYSKINYSFVLATFDSEKTILTFDPNNEGQNNHQESGQLSLFGEIESLLPGQSFDRTIFLKTSSTCDAEEDMKLLIRAKYTDGTGQSMICEHLESICVIYPFDIVQCLRSKCGEKITSSTICSGQESCLCVTIRNMSSSHIYIKNFDLHILLDNFRKQKLSEEQKKELIVKSIPPHEKLDLLFLVTAFCISGSESNSDKESMGYLDLEWFRDEIDDFSGKTEIRILPLTCTTPILVINGSFQRIWEGKSKNHIEVSYKIINKSDQELDLCASMDSTENFMNAGPKKVSIKLGAKDCADLNFILFPLINGQIGLPKLNIEFLPSTNTTNTTTTTTTTATTTTTNEGIDLLTAIYRDTPDSIFIKP